MTKHVLEFEDVWKTYSMGDAEVNALAGLNLALKEGSFTAVMGPSGSSKSTLLHLAGILDTPTMGMFRINGRQTSELALKEQALLRRNEIGFVFQRFNLLSQLSALENVMLPPDFLGRYHPTISKKRALELLEMVEIADHAVKIPAKPDDGLWRLMPTRDACAIE